MRITARGCPFSILPKDFPLVMDDSFHYHCTNGKMKQNVKTQMPPSSSSFSQIALSLSLSLLFLSLSLSLVPHYGPRPFSYRRSFHFVIVFCGMSMSILIGLVFFLFCLFFIPFPYSKFFVSKLIN